MSTLGDFWLLSVFEGLADAYDYDLDWAKDLIKKVMACMTEEDDKAIIETLTEEIDNNYEWAQVVRECTDNARTFIRMLAEEGITVDSGGHLSKPYCDTDNLQGSIYMGPHDYVCSRAYSWDEEGVFDGFYDDAIKEVGAKHGGDCAVGVPECEDVSYMIEFRPSDLLRDGSLAEERKRRYVNVDGGKRCPFCGSSVVTCSYEKGQFVGDQGGLHLEIPSECPTCKKEWIDCFTLTDVREAPDHMEGD